MEWSISECEDFSSVIQGSENLIYSSKICQNIKVFHFKCSGYRLYKKVKPFRIKFQRNENDAPAPGCTN